MNSLSIVSAGGLLCFVLMSVKQCHDEIHWEVKAAVTVITLYLLKNRLSIILYALYAPFVDCLWGDLLYFVIMSVKPC